MSTWASVSKQASKVWNSGLAVSCRRQVSKHDAVLVFCLSIGLAVLAWMQWASRGIVWAHARVADAAARAASAPNMPASSTSDAFAQIGQSGDAFGGGNALFAALAGALVFWAGYLQAKALKEARAAYTHQRFESTFFELLKLSRELQGRFETAATRVGAVTIGADTSGAETLERFARLIHEHALKFNTGRTNDVEMAKALSRDFARNYYDEHSAAFGPYFRALYQTFRLISDSALSPPDKVQFANIARGQLSEGAVFLLALNGLTKIGHNFIRYIEEFGLLEHMHRDYMKRYRPALDMGYHQRAFLGSKAREKHAPFERSVQEPDFFVP